MFYIVESDKSFYEVTLDLEPVVQRLGFSILHTHDLGDILHGRENEPDEDCKVFEISNYRLTEKMLALDMRLSLALPWRISVFTESGATKIGLIRPGKLLAVRGHRAELSQLYREMEEKLLQIVDETR